MKNTFNLKTGAGWSSLLGAAALALALLIVLSLTLCSLAVYAQLGFDGPYDDSIDFIAEPFLTNLLLTASAVAAIACVYALLSRVGGVRLNGALLGVWLIAAFFWVSMTGLVSETDFECVISSAERFAQDYFARLRWGYFMGSSYQLGICLIIEVIHRLLPALDVDIVMQCINTFLSVGFAGLLAAFAQEVFGEKKISLACVLLYVLYLPFMFYNHYVYGTLPMLFFGALSCFLFARYLKTRRLRLLIAMMIALGVSYVLKPNGVVVLIALSICGFLDALESGDWKPLLAGVLAFALGSLLKRAVIWQYELRAGFPLEENQTLLTWLVMAITPKEGVTPGWYTGYAGEFYDLYLPREEQSAIVMADLKTRLGEIAADPAAALAFFTEKILSQWMEPHCSVMAYGQRCMFEGRYNGLANMLFRPGAVNTAALAYANIYQQALYALASVGTLGLFFRRKNAAALALPIIVIGGFLFHTLMEAKSQYIYPYMIYMMPLAAYGLCLITRRLGALLSAAGKKRPQS